MAASASPPRNGAPEEKVLRALEDAVGPRNVTARGADRAAYAGGHSFAGFSHMPDYVVRATRTEQVQATIRVAAEHKVPVTPIMSATMDFSTVPLSGGICLDTSAMNKIREIDTDSDYAYIEPGVTIGQLNAAIRPQGYWAPFGSYPPWTCVLGNYTQRNHTSMRTSGFFDDIMGLEVVLGDSTLVRTGSGAFEGSTWHSPYGPFPDLRGLFLSAYGAFGVMTGGAVRIYPMNERQEVSLVGCQNYPQALRVARRASRAGIGEHTILWHWTMYRLFDALEGFLDPMRAAAVLGRPPWDTPRDSYYNMVTIQHTGLQENTEGDNRAIQRIAREEKADPMTMDDIKDKFPGAHKYWDTTQVQRWPSRTFVAGFRAFAAFPIVLGAPAKIQALEAEGLQWLYDRKLRFGLTYYSQLYDRCRSSSIRFTPFIDATKKSEGERAMKLLDEFYAQALKKHGVLPMRIFQPGLREYLHQTGGYYELWKKIKKAVDPQNILNPAVLY